jgi:hypothetical protein
MRNQSAHLVADEHMKPYEWNGHPAGPCMMQGIASSAGVCPPAFWRRCANFWCWPASVVESVKDMNQKPAV